MLSGATKLGGLQGWLPDAKGKIVAPGQYAQEEDLEEYWRAW